MSLTMISPFSILLDKGLRLEKAGRFQEAAETFRDATEQADTNRAYSEKDRRDAMIQCAINFRRTGGEHITLAMEMFNNLLLEQDDKLTGTIKREKAITLIQTNKPEKAIELLDEAFAFYKNSDNNSEIGAIISSIAKAHSVLGQKTEAIYDFERADGLLCSCNNIHELNNLIWWMELSNFKERLALGYRVIKLSIKTGYSIKRLWA